MTNYLIHTRYCSWTCVSYFHTFPRILLSQEKLTHRNSWACLEKYNILKYGTLYFCLIFFYFFQPMSAFSEWNFVREVRGIAIPQELQLEFWPEFCWQKQLTDMMHIFKKYLNLTHYCCWGCWGWSCCCFCCGGGGGRGGCFCQIADIKIELSILKMIAMPATYSWKQNQYVRDIICLNLIWPDLT